VKTIDNINLETWFTERELSVNPNHFIKTSTPMTPESKAWILEKLHGRFSKYYLNNQNLDGFGFCPTFEDPKEALFYELTFG